MNGAEIIVTEEIVNMYRVVTSITRDGRRIRHEFERGYGYSAVPGEYAVPAEAVWRKHYRKTN